MAERDHWEEALAGLATLRGGAAGSRAAGWAALEAVAADVFWVQDHAVDDAVARGAQGVLHQARAAFSGLCRARGWGAFSVEPLRVARLRLQALAAFAEVDLDLDDGQSGGWHVILGDNGTGKTTLLRALGAALAGAGVGALPVAWERWPRLGAGAAEVELLLRPPAGDAERAAQTVRLRVPAARGPAGASSGPERAAPPDPVEGPPVFVAGFGPFRRFDAGADAAQAQYRQRADLAPLLSLFDPGVALSGPLEWLRALRVREVEALAEGQASDAGAQLAAVKRWLNEGGLLPHGLRLDGVQAEPLRVRFVDGAGVVVGLEALSDGYRSVLSLALELLRLMAAHFGEALFEGLRRDPPRVEQGGIVLIDEADAHLHPSWQARLGDDLRRLFPRVQFIVTTHSPLVARAATGPVHQLCLPGPGEDGVQVRRIAGTALDRLRWGDLLEALEGPGFDLPTIGQSDAGAAQLERLAALRSARRRSPLSAAEEAELQHLDAVFRPVEAP